MLFGASHLPQSRKNLHTPEATHCSVAPWPQMLSLTFFYLNTTLNLTPGKPASAKADQVCHVPRP